VRGWPVSRFDLHQRSRPDVSRQKGHQAGSLARNRSEQQPFNTTMSADPQCATSFTRFEREVTDERIRDKIGASKRRVWWVDGSADKNTLPSSTLAGSEVQRVYEGPSRPRDIDL
jgi:hypothetical protein